MLTKFKTQIKAIFRLPIIGYELEIADTVKVEVQLGLGRMYD
jgi:hypothetical protein